MSNKNVRDGEFIRDMRGSVIKILDNDAERNKCYAVIVKCGHCGDGFYIPIMFTTRAKNVQNAIEDIKMTPRVKREKSDCILDAFEITELEKFTIDAVNDHDDYLKGFVEKDTWKMDDRRIATVFSDDAEIRTADQYHYYDVLARVFAPRYVGSELIVPSRINRKELIQEFMKVAAIRYGIKRDDPFFPMLYYMECGEDNDLGIKFDGKTLSYNFKNENFIYSLDEKILKYFDRFGMKTSVKKEEYFSGKYEDVKIPSPMEKFKARMDKFKKMSGSTPSEREPGQ